MLQSSKELNFSSLESLATLRLVFHSSPTNNKVELWKSVTLFTTRRLKYLRKWPFIETGSHFIVSSFRNSLNCDSIASWLVHITHQFSFTVNKFFFRFVEPFPYIIIILLKNLVHPKYNFCGEKKKQTTKQQNSSPLKKKNHKKIQIQKKNKNQNYKVPKQANKQTNQPPPPQKKQPKKSRQN